MRLNLLHNFLAIAAGWLRLRPNLKKNTWSMGPDEMTLTSPYVYFKTLTVGKPMPESTLKGQCHEIFCFWFFSWISFPQASDYTIRVVSNFFENSRRYSQLKVCHRCQRHRWQMEKTFKQKNFNNFVWTPLGSRVNICITRPTGSLSCLG
jgi:hypothetical protein